MFDVDKLNIYLPNYYEINGKLRKITDDLTYDYYLKNFVFSNDNINKEPMTFEEFEIKKLENKTYDIWNKIMLHPSNWSNLTSPITSGNLQVLSNEISELYGEKSNNTLFDYVTPTYQLDKFKSNMDGKNTVGTAVNFSTLHKLCQTLGIKLTNIDRVNNFGRSFKSTINLKHNNSNGDIILGGYLDSKNNPISTSFQEVSSATVDNAKENTLGKLNLGTQTLTTACFLILTGVSEKDVVYFLNQPIIRDYIKLQEINESITAEEYYQERFNKKEPVRFDKLNKEGIILTLMKNYKIDIKDKKSVMKMFYEKFNNTSGIYSTKELLDNIKNNDKSPKQVKILAEFLRYQELAKLVTNLQQAIKYDTNAYGGNIHELEIMLKKSNSLINGNDFINIKEMFNSGFISPYFKSALQVNKMFRDSFFTSFNNNTIASGYDYLSTILSSNPYISVKSASSILDKYIKTSISMEMLKLPLQNEIKNAGNTLGTLGTKVMYGKFLTNLKNEFSKEGFIGNQFVQDLQLFDRYDLNLLSNVKLKSDQRDKNITDVYIEALEELMDQNPNIGLYLFAFLMKQNGYQNSPLDFRRVFPTYRLHSETYADQTTNWILPNLLKQVHGNISDNINDILFNFFINNYEDKNIVPNVRNRTTKFINDRSMSRYINESGVPIIPLYKKWDKKLKVWKVYETLTDKEINLLPKRNIRYNMQELSYFNNVNNTLPINNVLESNFELFNSTIKLNQLEMDSSLTVEEIEEYNKKCK